jgi:hypothetical protein
MVKKSIQWQYNGIAPAEEIYSWCQANFANEDFFFAFETIYFYKESCYTAFLLKWS